ncbi:MAG TPA: dihydroorotase [Fimbriimonadaceae bacterium]|nr:dihydroorotase [Fimbriimonadaceae bacterium]
MRTILKNGRILDPSSEMDIVGSVAIEAAQVVDVGDDVREADGDEVYDCTGLWISPGLVDMHAHLREPGESHRETIKTGTQAAAAGGYTTVCMMPNTTPALDNPALVDFIFDRAASPEAGGVFVAPVGALTTGNEGRQISDLSALKRAGIVAASDEGAPIQNANVMRRAMEFCLQLDLPIMAHCEDVALTGDGCMNEGAMSAMLGMKGMPRSAEEVAIMRNCLLSLNTGCPVHILRVSTWGAVEMVRQAKYLGAPVTCDVSPHHFSLTEDSVGEFDVNFKTTPPLRTEIDVELVQQALQDGTIDCIASDHSPYAPYEVHTPFDEAPFGMAGLESAVAATLTNLTQRGVLSPLETIRQLSTTPAQILRLEAGTLKPGATPVAQVTVIDPNMEWTFDATHTFSKGKNSPFDGMQMQGKVVLTFCGGEIYRDGSFGSERYLI